MSCSKLRNVVFIEGPHGAGKSTLISKLSELGYKKLDENFRDMKTIKGLPAQSMTNELIWVTNQINSIGEVCGDNVTNNTNIDVSNGDDSNDKIIICDRSPYSIIPYGNGGESAHSICNTLREELEVFYNVIIIYIHVDKETLHKRILKRLDTEPDRRRFNEDKLSHLNYVYNFYESMKWDYCVKNYNVNDAVNEIEQIIREFVNPNLIKDKI